MKHEEDTVPKSLATVLEKRLLFNFTGNKVQKHKSDVSHICDLLELKEVCILNKQYPSL